MMRPKPSDDWAPKAEDLAAYVDGELDNRLRRQVEDWLVHHAEVAAEVEAHGRLARLWSATGPPQPSAAQWATVLARVEMALPVRSLARPAPWRRLIGIAAAVSGVAAAALAFVGLRHPAPEVVAPPAIVEPFTVVTPEDVEIVSLHAADRVTLVVGVPPVHGPLEFVIAGDVEAVSVKPDSDGMVPHLPVEGEPMAPMIVAPLEPGPSAAP
jgi:anti-sigma factor RsiW